MADKIEILVLERKYEKKRKKGDKVYNVEIFLKSMPVTPVSLAEANIGKQIERICDIILSDLVAKVNKSGTEMQVTYYGPKERVQSGGKDSNPVQ